MTIQDTAWAVDADVLTQLGWPEIISAITEQARTERGRAQAGALSFLSEQRAVERSLSSIEEYRVLKGEELELPLGLLDDIGEVLSRARKGGILEGLEVLGCARVMRTASEVRQFLVSVASRAPLLAGIAGALPAGRGLAARIEDSFEPDGRLRDDASFELEQYRNKVRSLHRRMRSEIEGYLKDDDFGENLQDDFFSVRGERYVLPIKSSMRSRVPGIIHNASNSGETVFIEPQALVGLGNELTIAQSQVDEEERRILAEFSTELGGMSEELDGALEVLAKIDVVRACGELSERLGACSPTLGQGACFELFQARHPLLVLQDKHVVANDIRLTESQSVLVISGPNAGGKTVAMTTIGLMGLMLRAGLPVPAAPGSTMPIFGAVVSTIGDLQSLSEDLSTFSAHLASLAKMLEQAGDSSLVLIDEIASGTDPLEGAALGQAVLEGLVDRGAKVLVTTHLEAIKALGMTDERFVNARVAYDAQSMKPTYRLELDVAGVSNALSVASHSGIPSDIIERAEGYLEGSGALSLALKRLQDGQRELQELKVVAERQKTRLQAEREEARVLKASLEEERLALEEKVREEIEVEFGAARDEVGKMIAELQAEKTMAAAQKAQRTIEATRQQARTERTRLAGEREARKAPDREALPDQLQPGMRVFLTTMKKEAEVISVSGSKVQVAVGAMKMRVRRDDLLGGRPSSEQAPEPSHKRREVRPSTEGEAEGRLDLRGLRADDVADKLSAFLDQAYFKSCPRVTIVHGHGSGAIRRTVREALECSPYVKSFRPGDRHEGGEGATIVELDG